jgi:accessory gene regulator protein AgrB
MKLNNKHQQRGMGLITGSIALFAFLFLVIVFLKLFPLYMDNMIVGSALQKIKETPNVGMQTDRQIYRIFMSTIDQENAKVFEESEAKEHIEIVRFDDEGMEITVTYQKKVPLIANVSFLLDFKNTISIDAP